MFASDSRTSAGRRQHRDLRQDDGAGRYPDERVVVVLSSGNLATTQSVIALLKMRTQEPGRQGAARRHPRRRAQMYDVAELVGETLREVVKREQLGARAAAWTSTAASSWAGRSTTTRRGSSASIPKAISSRRRRRRIFPDRRDQVRQADHRSRREVRHADEGSGESVPRLVRFDDALEPHCRAAHRSAAVRARRAAHHAEAPLQQGDKYFSEISGIWSAGLRRAFAEVPPVPWEDEAEK